MWLHRYANAVAALTLLLVIAGGLVTSTGSGLAVPDWPTTYGWSMFTFPFEHMVGGIFYEHGHRLIASTVGFLTIILAVWVWRADPRRWVRRIGFGALAAVVLQGLLGGLTVIWLLPDAISIAHAGLAQIFFCLTIALALFTSASWRTAIPGGSGWTDDRQLRQVATAATVIIYVQILLGALVRHTGAGLAIPDFPLVFGGLLPPVWTTQIAAHYAHRTGALVAAAGIMATACHVWYHHRTQRALRRPATLLVALLAVQIMLGALVVLTRKNVAINTAHVATGALVLATSLVLTLRSHRARFAVEDAGVSGVVIRAPFGAGVDRTSAGARA